MSPDYATTCRPLPAVEPTGTAAVQLAKRLTGKEEVAPERPFPVLPKQAMHGPVGTPVRALEPTTEADQKTLCHHFHDGLDTY